MPPVKKARREAIKVLASIHEGIDANQSEKTPESEIWIVEQMYDEYVWPPPTNA